MPPPGLQIELQPRLTLTFDLLTTWTTSANLQQIWFIHSWQNGTSGPQMTAWSNQLWGSGAPRSHEDEGRFWGLLEARTSNPLGRAVSLVIKQQWHAVYKCNWTNFQ